MQQQANEQNQEHVESSFKELSELYLFGELYRFFKDSTGLAITIAYLAMILSSMAYLAIFFLAFDINIVKYVTLEDILATPVKNPGIILVFLFFFFFLMLADQGNRFRAKQQIKYANDKKPFGFKVLQIVLWAPKNPAANIKITSFGAIACLVVFIFASASIESDKVKDGFGNNVEITLANDNMKIKTALLGTSTHYVFTYNHQTQESVIYYLQSINSIKSLAIKQDITEKELPISESN